VLQPGLRRRSEVKASDLAGWCSCSKLSTQLGCAGSWRLSCAYWVGRARAAKGAVFRLGVKDGMSLATTKIQQVLAEARAETSMFASPHLIAQTHPPLQGFSAGHAVQPSCRFWRPTFTCECGCGRLTGSAPPL